MKIWTWFVKKASIRKKLVISYMILVLIPILILGSYSFWLANNNLMNQTEKTMENNLERMVSEMNSMFGRENDFTKYLAYNLEFRETLETNAFDNSAIAQSLNKTVEPVFWYFIASDKNIKSICIVTPYTNDDIGSFLKVAKNYEKESWYQEHQTYFNTKWTVEDERLYATRTILDTATTSKMIGILRIEFYMSQMLEPFDTMDYLENGILVKDKNGQTVYKKGIPNAELEEQIYQNIAQGQGVPEIDGEAYILKSAYINSAEWDVYYYIDKNIIFEQTYSILVSTIFIVLLCCILILIFVGFISVAISSRILNLKKLAEKIAEGDLENPVFTEDTDEIGIVTNSIGKMTVKLNESINLVYKVELEKKVSELAALQAQINPHFLYNCLSSIKWKAIRKGDDDISDLAGLIAKFYRTSLNNGEPVTTVRSELENTKSYVEIQRKMHDEGFEVEYRLQEEGQECKMPNFLLQPVVENAVKHGIDYIEGEETGKIVIEFKREGQYLVFNIYNNGPLISAEEIDKIMHNQGKGYGIRNIMERIQLYYDKTCGVTVNVTADGYTCFTIRIYDEIQNATS